jgi:geranylgeranyl pyrophosphate synthase
MSSWEDVVHPAILALTCEAVGGNPGLTTKVGAAFVLLAGGADIHDDVIDESLLKYSKKTVFGKFGKDLAILAGDAFIVKALYALHESCDSLSGRQSKLVFDLTKQAFFGISSAEYKESNLRATESKVAEEYFDMIKMKMSVSETTARIGAILGGGSPQEIDTLAQFGRAFGLLMTLKDEFIDIFEVDEMKNRIEKEWLPLPILYTLKDSEKAKKLTALLGEGRLTEKKLEKTLDLVLDSAETRELKNNMRTLIKEQTAALQSIKVNRDKFSWMLNCAVEDL